MSIDKYQCRKSRRDDTLLTVGFNLRIGNDSRDIQSPAGTTLSREQVSSLQDLGDVLLSMFRRLKSTVNKVPSLRDFEGRLFRLLLRRLKPSVNNLELNSGSSLRDFEDSIVRFLSVVWLNKVKSRRDDTLLTVDFNLRTKDNAHTLPSPAWDDT